MSVFYTKYILSVTQLLAEITLHFNKICMYISQTYIWDVYAPIYANFSNPFTSAYHFFFFLQYTDKGRRIGYGIPLIQMSS